MRLKDILTGETTKNISAWFGWNSFQIQHRVRNSRKGAQFYCILLLRVYRNFHHFVCHVRKLKFYCAINWSASTTYYICTYERWFIWYRTEYYELSSFILYFFMKRRSTVPHHTVCTIS